jgi:hypothetical protein
VKRLRPGDEHVVEGVARAANRAGNCFGAAPFGLARCLLAAPPGMSTNLVALSSLVERVRRGEIAALAELYDSEASVLMTFALRLTADRRVAEQVVHEVFCALWRNPDAVGSDVRDGLVRSTHQLARAAAPPRERKRVVFRDRFPTLGNYSSAKERT